MLQLLVVVAHLSPCRKHFIPRETTKGPMAPLLWYMNAALALIDSAFFHGYKIPVL